MDYLVPFTDDHGTKWLFQGTKHVKRAWGNNPWRATTILYVAITTPDDRFEGTIPTGALTISAREVVRLVTSVRPTSTTNLASAIRTVLRFGTFFGAQIAHAYLAPEQRGALKRRWR